MFESLRWWVSLRRNVNFWDWVRDTYSDEGLRRLATEACDCSLINPYDPFGDSTLNQHHYYEELMRNTVKRLMNRYGDEIWSCCLGASGYDPEAGKMGLQCLANTELAFQVHNQVTFEEFLVRNALKRASQQVLQEGRKKRR
jgi:hypothetical protein